MLLATLCNIVIILVFSVQATPAPQSSSSEGVIVPTIPSPGSGGASSDASDSSTRNSAGRYRNPDGTYSNTAGRYRNPDGTYSNTAGSYRNSDSTDSNNAGSRISASGSDRDATRDSDSQRAYEQGARRYTDQRYGNSQSSSSRYRTQGIGYQQADASTSGFQTIIKSSQTCTLTPPTSDKGKEKIGDDCTSFGVCACSPIEYGMSHSLQVPGKYKAIVDCPMDMSEAGDYSQGKSFFHVALSYCHPAKLFVKR